MAKTSRRFVCIGYPESAHQNWRNILNERFIAFAVSPIHDMDIDIQTGELKKPHWHIYMEFDGKKSIQQIKEITDEIQFIFPLVCEDKRKAIRYFIHLDNPDKAQYEQSEVQNFGVKNLEECFLDDVSSISTFTEIFSYVTKYKVNSIKSLLQYAIAEHPNWLPFLINKNYSLIMSVMKEMPNNEEDTQG